MGGFNSFWWVLLSPVVGVFFVLASGAWMMKKETGN